MRGHPLTQKLHRPYLRNGPLVLDPFQIGEVPQFIHRPTIPTDRHRLKDVGHEELGLEQPVHRLLVMLDGDLEVVANGRTGNLAEFDKVG